MDGYGTLYVTDHDDDRIEEFTGLGTFLGEFGSYGLGDAELVSPEGIAATAQGLVYVADTRNDRVEEFAAAAVAPPAPPPLVTQWGSHGSGPGQFDDPRDVVADRSSGSILVIDENNHRVERFDASGGFLAQFAVPDLNAVFGDGQRIAVDAATGVIYVFNFGTDSASVTRVEKYSPNGTPLGQFGSYGTGPGQFGGVTGLSVDSHGNVYVADKANGRVSVFSSDGTLLREWPVSAPTGRIAIDAADTVYVRILGGVQRFETDGTLLGTFTAPGGNEAIAVDGRGNVFVEDASDPPSIAQYSTAGDWLVSFGTGPFDGGFSIDESGNLYVSSPDGMEEIVKYGPANGLVAAPPQFVRGWGTLAGIGAFQDPAPAALAPSGNLYVVELSDPELVIEYAPDGTVITAFGGSGTGPGQFREPSDLALAPTGDVYVTDYPDRIDQFTADGQFIRQWLAFGDGNPSSGVSSVAGIAVDDGGNVFVANTGTLKVEEFDATGTPITQWSIQTTDPFDACPDGLAFDPSSGDLWLVDDCLFLVQEYRTDGTFVSQFGSMGSAPGQFLDLERIAPDGRGHLFVPDAGNERIDEFDTLGNLISEWGTFGVMPGQVDEPRGIAATPTGLIYVVEENGARVQVFQGAAPSGDHLVLTVPAAAAAGVPFTITVAAENAAGQPLAAYRGTVHFTSSDAAASLPADYTFGNRDRGTHDFQVTLDTVNGAATQTIGVAGSHLTQGDASASIALFASGAGASVVVEGGASVATAHPPAPSPGHPLVVTLTSPQGGQVSFTTTSGGAAPPGFSALGVGMAITAPPATASQPLRLAFALDASLLPAGVPSSSVAIFRDGVAIADCAVPGGTDASPDPCVASRVLGGSVLTLTVLTSHASTWSVAVPCADCDSNDLAVTKIRAPKVVALTVKRPALTRSVTVQIQNRSPYVETIADPSVLANLVQLTVQSLGSCPSPEVVRHPGRKSSSFPVTLESKATLSVPFDVAFACANDRLEGAGHEDYSFTARVDHTAIGGGDAHVLDDVCPRSVPAGGLVDPFPEGKLVDKGCGTKKPDKTFGAPVLTDVSSK
jgi:DNA-binding beta-propeller fold protein YncE